MSEPLVVEIWGKPAGIVLREGNTFRFHALPGPSPSWKARNSTPWAMPGWLPRNCSRRICIP
ncbi:MAG: hypothetical protein ACHQPH_08980 [Reyranellales bacterium]